MWVFLGMETIANIKYRSHVDSDSCLLAVCRWLIPHEVAPQQSFTMLQPANAKVIIKNGTTKNNHIYFILQFDPLKHSINNSSCNLTYTPKQKIWKLAEMDADHVKAWSKGGATDESNCQMLCKTHNRAKGNK